MWLLSSQSLSYPFALAVSTRVETMANSIKVNIVIVHTQIASAASAEKPKTVECNEFSNVEKRYVQHKSMSNSIMVITMQVGPHIATAACAEEKRKTVECNEFSNVLLLMLFAEVAIAASAAADPHANPPSKHGRPEHVLRGTTAAFSSNFITEVSAPEAASLTSGWPSQRQARNVSRAVSFCCATDASAHTASLLEATSCS